MGDGKALQMATSHELGQNFARAFGITFTNSEGVLEHVWQTSWGASTRLIGALVMGHGDDFGLRLPPALAPTQVVVLVIKEDGEVRAAAETLVAELRADGHRVRLDDRTETSFGRRSVGWELKGVPVRVEVGPRDLAEGTVTLVTRHNRHKEPVPLAGVRREVAAIMGRGRARTAGGGRSNAALSHGGRGHLGRGHRGGGQWLRPDPPGGAGGGRRRPSSRQCPVDTVPAATRRELGRAGGHRCRHDRRRRPLVLTNFFRLHELGLVCLELGLVRCGRPSERASDGFQRARVSNRWVTRLDSCGLHDPLTSCRSARVAY